MNRGFSLRDDDPCTRGDARQQRLDSSGGERDAACRRQQAGPCQVDENRASAAGYPRPGVVVDFDHEIIKVVTAPQAVTGGAGKAANRPIVIAVVWILAPGVGRRDPPKRQQRARRRAAVGSPPQAHEPKTPARCAAIPFALVGLDAGSPKSDRNAHASDDKPSLSPVSRAGAYINGGDRSFAHGAGLGTHW